MLGSHSQWRRCHRRGSLGVRTPASVVGTPRPPVEHGWMAETELSATDLLLRAGAGEAKAVESIFPLVYDELRRIAHRHLARESTARTLTTTELVHEAYLRLIDQSRVQWNGRAHF